MVKAASVFNPEQVDGCEAPDAGEQPSQVERLFDVKADNRTIFCAAAQASKAALYLTELQGN